jgi:putative peptidoglycan lipid II flippase
LFILIIAAGTVPGGVVALQVGINFYYLPVALSAKAVGTVLLPRLSREALQRNLAAFRNTYERGVSWAWFVAIPAALTLLLMAEPIARALAFGRMRQGDGISLLAASIAGLALALVGATMFEFGKQACYARHDVNAPLVACVAMVALVLVGALGSSAVLTGSGLLLGLGVVVTLGELVRSFLCDRAACRGTEIVSTRMRVLTRHIVASVVTVAPGAVLARLVENLVGGHGGALLGVVVGVSAGLLGYLSLQAYLQAPELPPKLVSFVRRTPAAGSEREIDQ